MKIILLDIQTRKTAINKTIAGGFGTSSRFSDSRDIRILLLQYLKKKGVRVPLIELAYHAAIFDGRGYEVEVVCGDTLPKADIYIIYGSLVEHESEISAAGQIRKAFPGAKIGFIGLLPTVFPKLFLNYADFVVTHESEKFFLQSDTPVESLNGVINAGMFDNDLDQLPFPDWSFFQMNEFLHYPFFGAKPIFPVLTSRGCPLSCGYYCPYPVRGGTKMRYRSVDNVIEEIRYLKDSFNAEAVLFRDPILTFNKNRTIRLCDELVKHNLQISWACETHPAHLNTDLIDRMYEAGARAMVVGVESRTPEVLSEMKRKDTDEQHLKHIVSYSEKKGMTLLAGYILGNLSDTEETIKGTIRYALELNTSYAQFVISTPYPGTKYYEALKQDLTSEDWEQYDTYTLVFDHPHLTDAQLEKLKEKAFIQYYFRPQWIFSKYLKPKIKGLFC